MLIMILERREFITQLIQFRYYYKILLNLNFFPCQSDFPFFYVRNFQALSDTIVAGNFPKLSTMNDSFVNHIKNRCLRSVQF